MKITIPVSVGELVDKITILEIKSLFTDNEYVKKELKELNELQNISLENPNGTYVDAKGNIYIVDTGNNRILRFLKNGSSYTFSYESDYISGNIIGYDPDKDGITELGTQPGQFRQPQGIIVDSEGKIYVVDTGNHRIQIFK